MKNNERGTRDQKNVVMIIQARMGSTRLPGKSLMPLAGAPLVGRILERVKRAKKIDTIVLAIPDTKDNDPLEGLGRKYSVEVFRGSENDCLDRYYQAAKKYRADVVLRLPADNPMPEPSEIDRIVDFHLEGNFEWTSNLAQVLGNGYPDGIGSEAMDFSALEWAWKHNHDPRQREHVHLSFFDYGPQKAVNPKFRVGTVKCPKEFSRPDLVLDVNTQSQYDLISRIYADLYPKNKDFHITDIIQWFDERKAST